MSSALDANLLLYASDATSPRQHRAAELLDDLAAGPELLDLFWPVVVAYLRVATHAAGIRPSAPDRRGASERRRAPRPSTRAVAGGATGLLDPFA